MASSKTPMNGTENNNKTADVHDSASSDVLPNSTLLNKDPQQAENSGLANTEMHQPVVKDPLFIALLKQLWRSFKFYTRIIIYIPLLILVLLALILGTSIGSNIGITIASQLIPNLELNYHCLLYTSPSPRD